MKSLEILNAVKNQSKLVLVEDFEISVQHVKNEKKIFYQQKNVRTEWSEHFWVSLRLYHRKTIGEASFTISSLSEIPVLIEKAFYSVEISSADPWFHFPVWKPWQNKIQNLLPVSKVDFSDKQPLFSSVPEAVETHSESIVETCVYRKSEKQHIHFQNRFFEGNVKSEIQMGHLELPFERGSSQALSQIFNEDVQSFRNAKPYSSDSKLPLLFDGLVVAQVLEQFWPFFTSNFQKKYYGKQMRETLWETPVSFSNTGSFNEEILFDLEGVPTQKTNLVREGRFLAQLSDTYESAKENKMSTGNRVRLNGSVQAQVGPQYFYCEPGMDSDSSFEGISLDYLEQIRFEGYPSFVVSLLGHGYRWSGGRKGDAVSHIFVQSDIFKLFGSALKLNKGLKFVRNFGAPSISFSKVTL